MKMWYNMFINKLNNMIHHIVYRTTDVTTGEYYIGFHSYDDQDPPSYFGTYKRETHWEPDEENLIRETLMEFSSRDEAREAEPGFISPHLGHPLCMNLHATMMSKAFDNWGKKLSDETRAKISESHTGKPKSPEHIKAAADAHNYGPLSDELKKQISNSLKGHTRTKESRLKQSLATKGKLKSEETKQKMRKPKSIVQCPHCGLIGGGSRMVTHHFDNCKKLK